MESIVPDEDSTDRVADVTDTWEASPLTEPERAVDPGWKAPTEHGDEPAEPE